jgi:hypothetical protein
MPSIESNQINIPQIKEQETPEEYHETCRRFKEENNRYYTDNNFYRGNLLLLETGEPKDKNAKEILDDVHEYYLEKNDHFNLLRYYEKIGDRENSYKMAEQIESSGTPIEKAHADQHIWKYFKDRTYRERAISAFGELAKNYEENGDNLMAAINSDLLFKLAKSEEHRSKAIDFHRQFATQRKEKGDSWWEAISLREVGKLSKGNENQNEALDTAIAHANQELQRAESVGDFKNAGLWARDIFMLTKTPESRERAREIFLKQVEKSEQSFEASEKADDLRTVAKSYWEMWKVTGEEEHRLKALEGYKKLLEIAKRERDEGQEKECYRILLSITQ